MAEGKLGVPRPLVNKVGEGPMGFDRPLVETEEFVVFDIDEIPMEERRRLKEEQNIKV